MANRATIEISKVEYSALLNRIKFFQNIIREISERKPLVKLLDQIISSSKKLLDAEAASLLLFNKNDSLLYFHSIAGGSKKTLMTQTLKLGEGIGGWVAQNNKSLIINDCYSDSRFNQEFDKSTGFKTCNMICVPMISNSNLVGVIQAINKKGTSDFNEEDLQLFETLAAQCAVAIDNARLIEMELNEATVKHEMETAWKIQQNFLPKYLPEIKDVEYSIKLKPAKEVGGDYFNVVKIDDRSTLFFIGDVSGKSVPAALIVSTLYSFLETYSVLNKSIFDPILFVSAFNKFLINSTTPDKFVTAWFGFYDSSDRSLISISAGHNHTLILKQNSKQLTKLTAGGLMLGSMDFPYHSEKVIMEKGDLLVFYTDGIPEAMNNEEEEFGDDRFENLILENHALNIFDLSHLILDELKNFRETAEQSDDITIGVVRF